MCIRDRSIGGKKYARGIGTHATSMIPLPVPSIQGGRVVSFEGACGCYYMEQEKMLFSGDTLFLTSIGRSDLPTGSESTLIRSIKERLLVLPEEVKVFPGHMGATTIGDEKKQNPYIV